MKAIRLTLKNYRGFADSEPLYFEFGPGLTAIVGPNNSGKSAIKLFFYEFRHLFKTFGNSLGARPGIMDCFIPGSTVATNYEGVSDPEEVFNNSNDRPLAIEIEVLDAWHYDAAPNPDCLSRVVATCSRSAPTTWSFKGFGKNDPKTNLADLHKESPSQDGPSRLRWSDAILDCKDFQDAAAVLANSRYYGPFRNAINQGAGDYFDLRIGTAFVSLWSDWKTTGIRFQMRAIDAVTNDIRRLFEFDRLEINASDKLKTLMVSINGRPYRLGELGSGLAQFIWSWETLLRPHPRCCL